MQPSVTALTPALGRSLSSEFCTCHSCQDDKFGVCGCLLGDIDKSPSKNTVQSNISPSNESPSKNRRRKGDGSGSIHWRTIIRNGKDYPQAYYHWREDGRKRSKYISKALLGDIQKAEAAKRPVTEILGLLGVTQSPSKKALLGDTEISPSKNEKHLEISPSKNSPSKTRRSKGDGSGSIHWKTITRNGRDYPQAWYHYEFWEQGDRLVKSSKYIPKRLISQVQRLEQEKAPVREILKILEVIETR